MSHFSLSRTSLRHISASQSSLRHFPTFFPLLLEFFVPFKLWHLLLSLKSLRRFPPSLKSLWNFSFAPKSLWHFSPYCVTENSSSFKGLTCFPPFFSPAVLVLRAIEVSLRFCSSHWDEPLDEGLFPCTRFWKKPVANLFRPMTWESQVKFRATKTFFFKLLSFNRLSGKWFKINWLEPRLSPQTTKNLVYVCHYFDDFCSQISMQPYLRSCVRPWNGNYNCPLPVELGQNSVFSLVKLGI